MNVRLVISGRGYDTATDLPDRLTLETDASIDDALTQLTSLVDKLPVSCLLAVSGIHLGTLGNHREHILADGDEIVLIAPVAGG